MVANAESELSRLHALGYLLVERYEADAAEAGRKIGSASEPNEIRDQAISDLRRELAEPSQDLGYARFRTDAEIREYLSDFLDAFDLAQEQ